MPDTKELLGFYPESASNSEEWLTVGSLHNIYVASYGNPEGIPVIMLHGGPGSGTKPYFARYFDPQIYHIILADQRGAGRSFPKGEMEKNTTQHLIDDIEVIRKHFKIDKWAVFGGSWGSTLAMLYGEAHPDRVLGLILRGIFLVRADDISAFVRDDSPAAKMRGKEWHEFKARLTDLLERAEVKHVFVGRDPVYHIIYELTKHTDLKIQKEACGLIAAWESFNAYKEKRPEELTKESDANTVNMGLTEATYFEHGCFIEHNQILNNIDRLAGIRIYINQGDLDFVCPPYMADELEDALLHVNPDKQYVVRHNCFAGHSQMEPELIDALVRSGIDLALWLELKKKVDCSVSDTSQFEYGHDSSLTLFASSSSSSQPPQKCVGMQPGAGSIQMLE